MRLLNRVLQKRQLVLSLLCFMVLAACAPRGGQGGDPAAAVESYLNAMVKNESDKLAGLVCPAYEAGAKTDFDSFGAIGGVTLDSVKCTTGTVNGDSASVTCTGSIKFTYNGESQSQDLSANTYTTQKVDGEWKMCGYH